MFDATIDASRDVPQSSLRFRPQHRGAVSRIIRRAFVDPDPVAQVQFVIDGACRSALSTPPSQASRHGSRRAAVIVPTLGQRCTNVELQVTLAAIGSAMQAAESLDNQVEFTIIVAMQWPCTASDTRYIARLQQLHAWWRAHYRGGFIGVGLEQRSKIVALNACLPAVDYVNANIVGWFDDDVIVDPVCLRELLASFRDDYRGIYGMRKRTIADRSEFSSRWAARKNRIEPVNRHPHGCAIFMTRREFHLGIPACYQSDDQYYLLRYLEPQDIDPLRRLNVIEDAVVTARATNDASTTMRRIARSYRNGMRIMADAPPKSVHYFLRRILFADIRAPRASGELLHGRYWQLLLWQSLKLLFWSSLLAGVLTRGLIHRPHPSIWYAAPFPRGRSHDDSEREAH